MVLSLALAGFAYFTPVVRPTHAGDSMPVAEPAAVLARGTRAGGAVSDLGPEVVILRELQELYQPVPFNHRAHAQMADMWNGCVTCHHHHPNSHALDRAAEHTATGTVDPPVDQPAVAPASSSGRHMQEEADEIPACKSCHPIAADTADIAMPSLKGAYHRQCLSCHREWAHENACVVCHEPLKHEGELVHEPTAGDILGRMHPPIEPPVEKLYVARFTPVAGGNVLFRHDEHVARYGLRCVDCHQNDNCSRCHGPAAAAEHVSGPLTPADSWRQSHGPCLTCHAEQRCEHCHYAESQMPPAPFDHRVTGQLLDADHQGLACAQCHPALIYDQPQTCDTAGCHDLQAVYALPDHRPGDLLTDNTLTPAEHARRASMRGLPVAEPVIPTREPKAVPAQITPSPRDLAPSAVVPPSRQLVLAPAGPTATCVTDECHAVLQWQAVVHAPVGNNACGACHRVVDLEKHTFALLREDAGLCTYCHDLKLDAIPVVHEPLARGQCLGCHTPHGGETRAMTRESTVTALCDRCHESVTHGRTFAHTPVADGRCIDCHPPHAARFNGLVDVKGADLCLSCHEEIERGLGSFSVRHDAMDEGCLRCHDAHSSNTPSTLVDVPAALCMDCHESVRQAVTRAVYGHSVTLEDRACMTCHSPHGANLDHLMNDTPLRVCMTCHDRPIDAGGRTIAAIDQIVQPDTFKHGPIRDEECGGCHEPHGSNRPMLLSGAYGRGFYEVFACDKYELCFSCHEPSLVEAQWTQTATAFRNGQQNLHFIHVANWNAHSCAVCHESHAGPRQRHLRRFIPFGRWEVPLDYEKTDTGGQCGPGCHRTLAYDRQTPIALVQTILAPVERAARRDPPVVLHHAASDVAGRPIHIPDPGRSTILVMTRSGQATPTLFADLAAALTPTDNSDAAPTTTRRSGPAVVVVVSGDHEAVAPPQAAARGAHPPTDWPMVIDPEGILAQQLNVRAWPTLLIVQSDGLVVARIHGASPTLALKLKSYLRDPQTSGNGGVTPNGRADVAPIDISPEGIAERYRRVARRLIDEGRAQQADRVLDEGLALHPDATPLRILKVETLVQLGQAGDAMILLDQLNGDALDPTMRAVLRSRALIAAERWDEARRELTAALADHADIAELHELMGRIHEHHQQWQEAAEAYRTARELSRG